MDEKVLEKLKVLAESAKYDVSCASSGTSRKNKSGVFGVQLGVADLHLRQLVRELSGGGGGAEPGHGDSADSVVWHRGEKGGGRGVEGIAGEGVSGQARGDEGDGGAEHVRTTHGFERVRAD